MRRRRSTDDERPKALLFSGSQLLLGLVPTVAMASQDLCTQLLIQTLLHIGTSFVIKIWRRGRGEISGEETDPIAPR